MHDIGYLLTNLEPAKIGCYVEDGSKVTLKLLDFTDVIEINQNESQSKKMCIHHQRCIKFLSRSAHQAHKLTKADDLESLLLLALSLDNEHAHWINLKADTTQELNAMMLESKQQILSESHIETLPSYLQKFAWEICHMEDPSNPNYDKLIQSVLLIE